MRRSTLIVLLATALTSMMVGVPAAGASSDPFADFQHNIGVNGMMKHLRKFQQFADASDIRVATDPSIGTRLSGSSGYDMSVDYVAERAERAGYDVEIYEFEFEAWYPAGPSALERTAPTAQTYTEGVDFSPMSQTDPGDVTAAVTAVDLDLGLGNASTSGCEGVWMPDPVTGDPIPNTSGMDDFATFPAGDIALIQRGACTFRIKALNAAEAGAVGVILFNQGNTEARRGIINGTLSADNTSGIPVVETTYFVGEELAGLTGVEARVFANVFRGTETTYNVLADSPVGDPESTIVVGAHLDSVPGGPGIQDNGSGSALVLETAEQLSKAFHLSGPKAGQGKGQYAGLTMEHRVRFAWWGAEESGLVGSDHYVFNLPPDELAEIALYLNYDMVASPNFVRFIYDGDGSEFGLAGPPGSDEIEAMYEDHFAGKGLATAPTQIDFRSDYAAFFDSGIPFGGLFTGAEGIKTPAQVDVYGGTAGEQYDPCYHEACDDLSNITANGKIAYEQNADAHADVLLQLLTSSDLPG